MQALIIASTTLTAILAFGLGIFSLIKNPKSKVVQLWFLTSMAVTVWAAGYLKTLVVQNDAEAFFNLRIVYIGATLIPILFFHFVINFLYTDKVHRIILVLGYITALVFLILVNFTHLIIKGALFMEGFGRYEEVTTVGFKLFLVYFFFFVAYSGYLLFAAYKKSNGLKRKQIFLILLAAIFGIGGGASNFVMDFTGTYPYGQLVVWLYPILITYGVFVEEIKFKIKF